MREGAIVVEKKELSAKAVSENKMAVYYLGEVEPDVQYISTTALQQMIK